MPVERVIVAWLEHLAVRSLDNEHQHTHSGVILLEETLEVLDMFESSGTDRVLRLLPIAVREVGDLVFGIIDLLNVQELLFGASSDILNTCAGHTLNLNVIFNII